MHAIGSRGEGLGTGVADGTVVDINGASYASAIEYSWERIPPTVLLPHRRSWLV